MDRFCTLLVEIGTEDLPSKMLRIFGRSFLKSFSIGLHDFNIAYKKIVWFASSRRLAVKVIGIKKPKKLIKNAYNFNIPVRIQKYFLKNVKCTDTMCLNDKHILLSIKTIISNSLLNFPVSQMMSWTKRSIRFIRPVRTVTVLLDDQIIPCDFFGISSDRVISGHRFMGDKKIILDHADNYSKVLARKGLVIANYNLRKKIIVRQIKSIVKKIGGIIDFDDILLDEVTSLVEWPVVCYGSFNDRFLDLPDEILLYLMRVKQKYFPVYDVNRVLLPSFIFVVDIISKDINRIINGHNKVLDLLLSDAEFFWTCDKKCSLESYLPRLRTVLFHKNLGTLYDKIVRMKILSSWFALEIGCNDNDCVKRAVTLSKCDLMTRVVNEFPFAQGIVGMYYARRDGEKELVALAQREQYLPKCFSDLLPSTYVSCILSIVDKIDIISGMFIIGEFPKGSGDPLGLRRAAFGILRIVLEKNIKIDVYYLIRKSIELYSNHVFVFQDILDKILSFMCRRLCALYRNKGYREDIIRSVIVNNFIMHDIIDCEFRIKSISDFCKLQESSLLFAMYRRISNILKKVSNLQNVEMRLSLFFLPEEKNLATVFLRIKDQLQDICEEKRYHDALMLLVDFCNPVDIFFNSVTIMTTNDSLRLNRLSLLANIHCLCSKIVNISLLKI